MEISNRVSFRMDSTNLIQAKSNTGKNSVGSTTEIEPGDVWHKVGLKYDIHNITTEETASLSQELYDAGEISLFDHAILSFDPDHNLPYGTGFLTKADNSGRRDLILEYKKIIAMDKNQGDSQSLAHDERIFGYLERLESAKKPIHIIA